MSANPRTVTASARSFASPPIAGSLVASRSGKSAFRLDGVTNLRAAGKPNRYRLICAPLRLAELPAGAAVLPWPIGRRVPRPARRSTAARPSADSGPPEPARARLDRLAFKVPILFGMATHAIRTSRRNAVAAGLARAAHVGQDTGRKGERDHGPGLRLHAVRDGAKVLRLADVEMTDGPHATDPNVTVRRARRVDPLEVLHRAGSIETRHLDAAEQLRASLENLDPPTAAASMLKVSTPLYRGLGERQLVAAEAVRTALAAIAEPCRPPVLWACGGGTLSGFAKHARCRQATVAQRLRSGLDALADHLFGVGGSFTGRGDYAGCDTRNHGI
jgi:hypothetical protein